MRVMAGSLGVNCGFCHVEDRSKDDLMTKQTARKMITMMMEINKNNFDARQEVTCYTCHKGTNDPVSTLQYSDEPAAPRPGGREAKVLPPIRFSPITYRPLAASRPCAKSRASRLWRRAMRPRPRAEERPRPEALEAAVRLPLLPKAAVAPAAAAEALAAVAAKVLLLARHKSKSSSI